MSYDLPVAMRRNACTLATLGLVVACAAGCNTLLGNDAWTLVPPADGGSADALSAFPPPAGDASPDSAAWIPPDTGTQHDTSRPPMDSGQDSGLSPLLVLPTPGGASCDPATGSSQCSPGSTTCRISSPNGGTCDAITMGHEGGFPCTLDSDCDDTLQCYNGTCHVLCTSTPCAGGCACFPVGNATVGLCCPGQ